MEPEVKRDRLDLKKKSNDVMQKIDNFGAGVDAFLQIWEMIEIFGVVSERNRVIFSGEVPELFRENEHEVS